VWATPAKKYTAHTVASALFTFSCTCGTFDELWSDPGSDLMAEVVQKLSEWMSILGGPSRVKWSRRHEQANLATPEDLGA